jgi:hypothetical protein
VPFTYAEIRPYAVTEPLDELRGPVHGGLKLAHQLAWSCRRRFDFDNDRQRARRTEWDEHGNPTRRRVAALCWEDVFASPLPPTSQTALNRMLANATTQGLAPAVDVFDRGVGLVRRPIEQRYVTWP